MVFQVAGNEVEKDIIVYSCLIYTMLFEVLVADYCLIHTMAVVSSAGGFFFCYFFLPFCCSTHHWYSLSTRIASYMQIFLFVVAYLLSIITKERFIKSPCGYNIAHSTLCCEFWRKRILKTLLKIVNPKLLSASLYGWIAINSVQSTVTSRCTGIYSNQSTKYCMFAFFFRYLWRKNSINLKKQAAQDISRRM